MNRAPCLLERIRAVIERPAEFDQVQVSQVLTDAGEAIVMLKRIVAKHVRDKEAAPGSSATIL